MNSCNEKQSIEAEAVLINEVEHMKENIIPQDTGWDLLTLYNSFKQGRASQNATEQKTASLVPNKDKLLRTEDPLEVYYIYLRHLKNAYPSGHPDFVTWLEKAIRAFRRSEQYKNDRRYLWMWLNVAGRTTEPTDVFKYLRVNEIGTELPAYYEQYAKYLETVEKFEEAKSIIEQGINRNVNPERLNKYLEELNGRMKTSSKFNEIRPLDTHQFDEETGLMPSSPLTKVTAKYKQSIPQIKIYNDVSTKNSKLTTENFPICSPNAKWSNFGSVNYKMKENISTSDKWKNFTLGNKRAIVSPQIGSASKITVYRDSPDSEKHSENDTTSSSRRINFDKTRVLREKSVHKLNKITTESTCRHPAFKAVKDINTKKVKKCDNAATPRKTIMTAKVVYSDLATTVNGVCVFHEFSFEELRAKKFLVSPKLKNYNHAEYDRIKNRSQNAKIVDSNLTNQKKKLRVLGDTVEEEYNNIYDEKTLVSVTLAPHVGRICTNKPVNINGPEIERLHSTLPNDLSGFINREDIPFDFKTCMATGGSKSSLSSKGTVKVCNIPLEMEKMKIIKKIGEGGFGEIYLVEMPSNSPALRLDTHLKDPNKMVSVVVKVMHGKSTWEYNLLSRLQSRLPPEHSERVIRPYSCVMFRDRTCMFMDYLKHDTLLHYVNKAYRTNSYLNGLDESLVAFWTIEIMKTVEVIHSVGVIHRDIKPDNFLLRLNKCEDDEPYSDKKKGIEEIGKNKKFNLDPIYRACGSGGWKYNGLVLIDWGRSIDLEMFMPETKFYEGKKSDKPGIEEGSESKAKVASEEDEGDSAIECWEAMNGQPYKYEHDWYAAAGVVHTLIFGKYMKVKFKDEQNYEEIQDLEGNRRRVYNRGEQPIIELDGSSTFKRYWQLCIWKELFNTLLNVGRINSSMKILSRTKREDEAKEDKASSEGPRDVLMDNFPAIGRIREIRERLEKWLGEINGKNSRSVYETLRKLSLYGV